ncbi:MAG: hypothetical protein JKP98_02495 [Rhodobacteraceae bacterium]|jgi:hypothetical protein|nr:hypothetical protein [Paracoccaceae bacterium]MBL4556469.1 hypothetical protein [Paracoccaceae bacterium]HBG97964.1 hypothetical protein [Paracoccaceae bacterium]
MKRPSREEYQNAVALARAAIRAAKDAPPIRADRSPQAVLAAMQAKNARGEAVTDDDLGAMAAALAEHEGRAQRGRGRPKGTSDRKAHRALRAAIRALSESRMAPYRNRTGPRLSQCDAIADAMRDEGFRRFATYDSARRAMLDHRRMRREAGKVLTALLELSKALDPARERMLEIGRAFAGLNERVRALVAIPPETLKAVQKIMETMR